MRLQWKVALLALIPLLVILGFQYWSFHVSAAKIIEVRAVNLVPADDVADAVFRLRSVISERGFLLNRAILFLVNGDKASALRLISERKELRLERNVIFNEVSELYVRHGLVDDGLFALRSRLDSLDVVDSAVESEIVGFSGGEDEIKRISERSIREVAPLRDDVLVFLDRLYDDKRDVVQHTREVVADLQDKASELSFIGLFVSLGVFVLVVVLISLIIISPIRRITEVIDDISKGNIDVEVEDSALKRDDEVGDLARAFDRTVYSLKLAMRRVPKDDKKSGGKR